MAGLGYLLIKETSPAKKITAKIPNTKLSKFIGGLESNFFNKVKNIHPNLFVNLEKIKENLIPVGSGLLFIIGQIVNKNNEIAELKANISNQNNLMENEKLTYKAQMKKVELLEEVQKGFLELQKDKKELIKKNEELTKQFDSQLQCTSKEKALKEKEILKLTELINSKNEEIVYWVSAIDGQKVKIQQLIELNQALEGRVVELEQQDQSFNQKFQELKKNKDEFIESEKKKKQAEVKRFQSMIDEIAELKQLNDEKEERISALSFCDPTNEQIKQLTEENVELKKKLKELKAEIKSKNGELVKIEKEVNTMKANGCRKKR